MRVYVSQCNPPPQYSWSIGFILYYVYIYIYGHWEVIHYVIKKIRNLEIIWGSKNVCKNVLKTAQCCPPVSVLKVTLSLPIHSNCWRKCWRLCRRVPSVLPSWMRSSLTSSLSTSPSEPSSLQRWCGTVRRLVCPSISYLLPWGTVWWQLTLLRNTDSLYSTRSVCACVEGINQ